MPPGSLQRQVHPKRNDTVSTMTKKMRSSTTGDNDFEMEKENNNDHTETGIFTTSAVPIITKGTVALTEDEINIIRKAILDSVERQCSHDVDDKSFDRKCRGTEIGNTQSMYSMNLFLCLFHSPETLPLLPSKVNVASGQRDYKVVSTFHSLPARQRRTILFHAIENNFGKGHTRRFFSSLHNIVLNLINNREFLPTNDANATTCQIEEDGTHVDEGSVMMVQNSSNKCQECLLVFLYATEAVRAYFTGLCNIYKGRNDRKVIQPTPVCAEVYELALTLHNLLYEMTTNSMTNDGTIQSMVSKLNEKILLLCETWWLQNGPNRELLVLNVLTVLVQAALDGQSIMNKIKSLASTAIKRLYNIRNALEAIDFNDPQSDEFTTLLLQLVSSPECLNSMEGRRLLAFLLHADVTLMKKVHQSIRVQIPNNRPTILKAFGEIYFRAWQDASTADCDDDEDDIVGDSSSTNIRSELETIALEELMYAGIHAANPKMVQSILIVLASFHDAKKDREVAALLFSMYGPFIWRSLSATNEIVRANAVTVLAEVFPLVNQKGHSDEAILQGCAALIALLQDHAVSVRVAAAQSLGKILSAFWEVIPTTEIRRFMNLLMEHASDVSSAVVRVTALNTFSLLLEASTTHAVLRPLLPKLGNLIHDKVEKVRAACVRMLLKIKKTQGIKYYHVVPVDHLIARLSAEGLRNPTNTVASLLTRLMLNSYLPQNVEGSQQIHRTIKFLSRDPEAARVFYANVADHLSLSEVTKLAAMLIRFLYANVESQQKLEKMEGTKTGKRSKRHRSEEVDAKHSDSEILSISSSADLAEIICFLWLSIEKDLRHNEECNQFLNDQFSGSKLTSTLAHFEKQAVSLKGLESKAADDCYRCCAALLRCAGRLTSKSVDGLVPHILETLKSLIRSDDEYTNSDSIPDVTAHIALLCLWGMTDAVATAIAFSLESAFENDHELLFGSPCADSRKRKSGRRRKDNSAKLTCNNTNQAGSVTTIPLLPAPVALKLLGDILHTSDPSSTTARELLLSSDAASHSIEKALERGSRHAEKILSADIVYTQSIREHEASFIVSACECFGRFILHKDASSNDDLVFGDQALRLLNWTTHKVVSAFNIDCFANAMSDTIESDTPTNIKSSIVDPFDDLNISSIAVEHSFIGYSPVVTGPPRRRFNLSRTPIQNLSDNYDVGTATESNREREKEAAHVLSKAMAVSLLQSSCVIFAEWLAVGGEGAKVVATSAVEWCKVFHGSTNLQTLANELLPAFLRLALQLIWTASDGSLLKRILTICGNGSSKDFDFVEKAFTSLIPRSISYQKNNNINKHRKIVSIVVDCVLCAAYKYLPTTAQENLLEKTLPESIQDCLLTCSSDSIILSSLEIVTNNCVSCKEMVNQIMIHLRQLSSIAGIDGTEPILMTEEEEYLLDAKLLYILLSYGDDSSNDIGIVADYLDENQTTTTKKLGWKIMLLRDDVIRVGLESIYDRLSNHSTSTTKDSPIDDIYDRCDNHRIMNGHAINSVDVKKRDIRYTILTILSEIRRRMLTLEDARTEIPKE